MIAAMPPDRRRPPAAPRDSPRSSRAAQGGASNAASEAATLTADQASRLRSGPRPPGHPQQQRLRLDPAWPSATPDRQTSRDTYQISRAIAPGGGGFAGPAGLVFASAAQSGVTAGIFRGRPVRAPASRPHLPCTSPRNLLLRTRARTTPYAGSTTHGPGPRQTAPQPQNHGAQIAARPWCAADSPRQDRGARIVDLFLHSA
jgi:hypothetical protein